MSINIKNLTSDIYTKIWNITMDGMVLSDENGTVLQVNNRYCEIYGYEEKELIGKNFAIIYPPEYRNTANEHYKNIFNSPNNQESYEVEIVRKDGQKRWVESRTEFLLEKDVKIAMLSVIRDITEKREKETELRKNEANLKAIFNNSLQLFIMVSMDFKVISINKIATDYYKKLLGRNVKPGDNMLELVYHKHVEDFKKNANKCLKGKTISAEKSLPLGNDTLHFNFNYIPVIENDGKINKFIFTVLDITEKKKNEISLKKSEQRYYNFLDVLPQIVFEIDKNLTFTFLNKFARELFELNEEDIKNGKISISDVFPKEEIPRILNAVENIVKGNYQTGNTYSLRFNDQKMRVQIFNTPIINNEQVVGFRGMAIDVSKQFEYQKKLEESEERFKAFMDNFPGAAFIKDGDSKLIYCNTLYASMAGAKPRDLINRIENQNLPEELQKQYEKENKQVIDQGKVVIAESKYEFSGESSFWQTYKFPIPGKNKNLLGAVSFDITESKKSQEKIKESEKKLKLKLDFLLTPEASADNLKLTDLIEKEKLQEFQDAFATATGVASIITDPDGIPLTRASNFTNVCALIRKTRKGTENCIKSDKIIGMHALKSQKPIFEKCRSCGFIDAGAPINVGGINMGIWLVGQTNMGGVSKKELAEYADEIGADKNAILEEYSKMDEMSIEQFENVANLLWIFARELSSFAFNNLNLAKKIEELKENENQLIEAKNKAEESDRLKSAFLANVSHEVRTPMNGILGFANLLKEPELSPENQEKYLEIIERSGRRMLNTINDLVEISKIDSGTEKLMISEINLKEAIGYILTFFKPEAKKNKLVLINLNENNEEIYIESDKEKLYAILTNLVKNAIKYTNEGGIQLGYTIKEDDIEIMVKDTGIGIAKDKHESVFDRFVQADLSLSKPYEGVGLGLSITKAYVEMLGGKIWVESEPGEGSEFHFTIPYKVAIKNIDTNNQSSAESKKNSSGISIQANLLVVDDDEVSRIFLSKILNGFCKNLFFAENGQEAIDIYDNEKDIDVILMDIKMPVMDGYQAMHRIKELDGNPKIIAQSAYAMESDRQKALSAGFDDYIAKPIQKEKLLEMVMKHADKKNTN